MVFIFCFENPKFLLNSFEILSQSKDPHFGESKVPHFLNPKDWPGGQDLRLRSLLPPKVSC